MRIHRILLLASLFCTAVIVVPASPAAAAGPDLTLVVVDVTDPVEVGDEARFTATVTNSGSADATAAQLTWSLQSGHEHRASILDGTICPATIAESTGACALGTLAPSASKTIEVYTTAAGNAPAVAVAYFTAQLAEADANSADNAVTVETALTAPPVGVWKQQTFRTATPGLRIGSSVAVGPGSGRVVMFGGAVRTGSTSAPSSETWQWLAGTWSKLTTTGSIPARAFAQMTQAINDQPVVFGGFGATAMLRDTWILNGETWQQRATSGVTPPARALGGLAESNGTTVLFGGVDEDGADLGDTWIWDGTVWTKLAIAGPSARSSFAFAADRVTGDVILFGGCCTATGDELGDTWRFRTATRKWEKLVPAASPSAREGASASWSRPVSGVVLFGGMDNAGTDHNDVWVWTGSNWVQQTVTGTPPAPRDSGITAFAPATGVAPGRLIIYGGWDDEANYLGDVYSVALPSRSRFTSYPSSINYGGEIISLTKKRRVSVTNEGYAPGVVGTPSITGTHASEYSITYNGCGTEPVPGSQACEIEVGFSPRGATANRVATLWVPTPSGTLKYSLAGQGLLISARTPGNPTSNKSVNATFPVSWGPLSNVTNYDVEWTTRARTSTGAYVQAPWKTWKSQTTSNGAWFGGAGQPISTPGTTYLFRARGRTASGLGPWSATTSAVVPIDDRSSWLRWTGTWSNVSASGRYFSTLRQTTVASTASLVADGNMFWIVGEKCSTCGQFKVYVDNVYVATVDTRGTSPLRDVLWSRFLPGGIKRHTIKIVTLRTAGRPTVKLDAFGIAR